MTNKNQSMWERKRRVPLASVAAASFMLSLALAPVGAQAATPEFQGPGATGNPTVTTPATPVKTVASGALDCTVGAVKWSLDSYGLLTISGNGTVGVDLGESWQTNNPWSMYADQITSVHMDSTEK